MSVNAAATQLADDDFGLDNLPYGSCMLHTNEIDLCVRIGDFAISLRQLSRINPTLENSTQALLDHHNLDLLLSSDSKTWSLVHNWVQSCLTDDSLRTSILSIAVPLSEVTMQLPFTVKDYVDFYASENHATNVGKIFRPAEAPLKPNWKHIPVGYHGRSSTIKVSGTNVIRPKGVRTVGLATPEFGQSMKLDFEVELGFVCGGSQQIGEVNLKQASENHLFGVVILNDWSARDIQAFEYVPLGPNLGKSFATSISAWVTRWESLKDSRVSPPARTENLAAYLDDSNSDPYGLNVEFEVEIDGEVISRPQFESMYWTAPQMLAHITVNNATLSPGDLFGSGTVSGSEPNTLGSLLELSMDGKTPLHVNSKVFSYLEDGQKVTIRGYAKSKNAKIAFSECSGTIIPST